MAGERRALALGGVAAPAEAPVRKYGCVTPEAHALHLRNTGEFLRVLLDGADVTDRCVMADDTDGVVLLRRAPEDTEPYLRDDPHRVLKRGAVVIRPGARPPSDAAPREPAASAVPCASCCRLPDGTLLPCARPAGHAGQHKSATERGHFTWEGTYAEQALQVAVLRKTCESCPAQWEGRTADGRHVYARFRHGWLSVGVGDTAAAACEQAMAHAGVVSLCPAGMEGRGDLTEDQLRTLTEGLVRWP